VKQDAGRLSTENNQLHEQLILEAERYEQLQRESYQRTKSLEDKVAELSYWKQQAISRYDGLDRDNQALRKRIAELIKMGEKRSKAGACGSICCACDLLLVLVLTTTSRMLAQKFYSFEVHSLSIAVSQAPQTTSHRGCLVLATCWTRFCWMIVQATLNQLMRPSRSA